MITERKKEEEQQLMVTNFVDADGDEQHDRRVLLAFDLHVVGVAEMEVLLVDFGHLERECSPARTVHTITYLVTILLDREGSAADVAGDAEGAEFARLQLVRIVKHRWTVSQRADGVTRSNVIDVPSGRSSVAVVAWRTTAYFW